MHRGRPAGVPCRRPRNLDSLADLNFRVGLSDQVLAEEADLALRLNQRRARANGALLTQMQRRPYAERSETEQLGMRSAVEEVVNALLLLDVVVVRG